MSLTRRWAWVLFHERRTLVGVAIGLCLGNDGEREQKSQSEYSVHLPTTSCVAVRLTDRAPICLISE